MHVSVTPDNCGHGLTVSAGDQVVEVCADDATEMEVLQDAAKLAVRVSFEERQALDQSDSAAAGGGGAQGERRPAADTAKRLLVLPYFHIVFDGSCWHAGGGFSGGIRANRYHVYGGDQGEVPAVTPGGIVGGAGKAELNRAAVIAYGPRTHDGDDPVERFMWRGARGGGAEPPGTVALW